MGFWLYTGKFAPHWRRARALTLKSALGGPSASKAACQLLPPAVGGELGADRPRVMGCIWLGCFYKQLQTEGKILDYNLKAHWEMLILPLIKTRAFNIATGIFFPSP